MRIVATAYDRGGCTGYRVTQPTAKIKKLGLAEVEVITKGDDKADEKVAGSEIFYMGRTADPKALPMIERLKGEGKKIVYDLDDSMFNVSPFSPHYAQLGIMPVDFEAGGRLLKAWKDGENGFDVAWNRKIRAAFIEILRQVDTITVTTEPLRELYSRYNDSVVVVPNAIDFALWKKPPIRYDNGGKVRVVYAAGSNHQEDWMFVRSILKRLQDELPNWTLCLQGVSWEWNWGDLDRSRIEVYPWVDFEAYHYATALICADIGLAPISEIDFNECRSSIKWCEYSAYKVATIATDFGPYRRDCRNGEDALLVRGKDGWYEGLRSLITDESKRLALAQAAHDRVKRDFNLDFMVDRWMEAFSK